MVLSLDSCQDLRQRWFKWHTTEGVATATGTEGAGGKLSWISDGIADYYESNLKKGKAYMDVARKYTMPGQLINKTTDLYGKADNFIESESSKSGLRGAEITSFLSGLPVVGNFVRGVEGVNQLEDLYNNTGKTTHYPGIQTAGASGLGQGATQIGKIASGSNDLYQYYAGESDNIQAMYG